MYYFAKSFGAVLTPTFTGLRNSLTGKIMSKKGLPSVIGTIVFGGGTSVQTSQIEDLQARGISVALSADGSYATLHAPFAVVKK